MSNLRVNFHKSYFRAIRVGGDMVARYSNLLNCRTLYTFCISRITCWGES